MDTTEKEPYLTHTMLKVHFLSPKIGFDKTISCKIRPTLIYRKCVTLEKFISVKNSDFDKQKITFSFLNEFFDTNLTFESVCITEMMYSFFFVYLCLALPTKFYING